MKRYIPIIVGIVALCAVLYVGDTQMKKHDMMASDDQKSDVAMKSFQGSVTKEWEGSNTLEYGFDLPETATTTTDKDGALVSVLDNDAPVLEMYTSFEGARGYTPADYISNVIVPNFSAITDDGTTTIGSYEWTVVESRWSEWHIASVANGNWLLVVENKKADHDKANTIIESMVATMQANGAATATPTEQ
jgi:hypothetical protein